jgi:hypothetical protein
MGVSNRYLVYMSERKDDQIIALRLFQAPLPPAPEERGKPK